MPFRGGLRPGQFVFLIPIMIYLTASDGTLFEPHLNGLNHRKIQMGQLNLFELIQTPSAAAAACPTGGLSHSVANFALFASFAIF